MKKALLLFTLAAICNWLYAQSFDYHYHIKDNTDKVVSKANICIERGTTNENGCFHINTRFDRSLLIEAEGYKKAKLTLKADATNIVVLTPTSGVKSSAKTPELLRTDFECPLFVVNGTYIPTFKPSNYTNDVIATVTTTNKWNKITRKIFNNSDIESIDVVKRGVVMITTHKEIAFNTPQNKLDYTIIVTDPDGNPIKNARVYIRIGSSDKSGNVKFSAKPNQRAIIVSNKHKDFPFIVSEQSEVDITLERKPKQEKSTKKSQTMASFRNGDVAKFSNWIADYAHNELLNCRSESDTFVRAKFVVGASGDVVSVEIVKHNNSRAAKVVKKSIYNSPKWSPAIQDGKAVKMSFYVPVRIPAL